MSEKSELASLFRGLGLVPLTGSTFCAKAGDLYHLVGIAKDRSLNGWKLDVGVWHPSLGDADSMPSLLTPLLAMAAPDGAIEDWTWQSGSIDAHQIERVVSGFFLGFLKIDDISTCMEDRWNWPPEKFDPSAQVSPDRINASIPAPKYRVVGGMTSLDMRTQRLSTFLHEICAPLGFERTPTEPLVVKRKRDSVWDCVAFRLDKFGTLAAISIFHWMPELWRVEPRLKGTYHPFNGYSLTEESGRILLLDCVSIEAGAPNASIRDMIDDTTRALASEVIDTLTFCASVHEEYKPIAQKLLGRG